MRRSRVTDELARARARRRVVDLYRYAVVEELPLFGPPADVDRALRVVDDDPTDDELDVEPELVRQTEELPLGWGEE